MRLIVSRLKTDIRVGPTVRIYRPGLPTPN